MKAKTNELFQAYLAARIEWMRIHVGIKVASTDETKAAIKATDDAWAAYYIEEEADETATMEQYLAGVRGIELLVIEEVCGFKRETGLDPSTGLACKP